MTGKALPLNIKTAEAHLMKFLSVEGVTGEEKAIAAAVSSELKKVGVPAELHHYATGGHGFGLRPQAEMPCTQWPLACENWLRTMGYTRRGL